jgi:hypothetical protein
MKWKQKGGKSLTGVKPLSNAKNRNMSLQLWKIDTSKSAKKKKET